MTAPHRETLEAAGRSATIARGATVTFVGHLAGRGLGFVITVLLTRWLGARDFGLFVLAVSIGQVASLFADLGLRDGALRFVALAEGRGDRAERTRVIGTVLRYSAVTSLAAAGVLAAGASFLAQGFRQPALRWMIPILAAGLPPATLGLVLRNVLQALKQFPAIAFLQNVVDPSARILVFVGCATLGWGVAAAVTSHVVAAGVVLVGAIMWMRPWWPAATDRLGGDAARAILAFSIPLSLAQLAGLAMQSADSLFLGYFTSAHDLGVYGAAGRVAALGGMTLVAGSMAFAPHANELYGRGDRRGIQRLYGQVTRWLITISLPVFALIVTFAAPLLGLFGAEFREGSVLLVVLAAGVFVTVATGPAGDVVLVAGRSKVVLVVGALIAALNVGLQWALVPRWGVLGAALATAGAVAISNVLNVLLGWWLLRLQPYSAALARPLALAGAAGILTALVGAVFGIDSLPGGVGVVAIWVVGYPLLVLRVGLVEDDRTALRALLRPNPGAPRWSEGG